MRTTRPMTDAERRYLRAELADTVGLAPTPLGLVLVVALPAAIASLGFSLAWVLGLNLIGLLPPSAGWNEVPVAYGGMAAITILSTGLCLYHVLTRYRRAISGGEKTRDALSTDLRLGQCDEEAVTIAGVKRFKDPEHGMKIYCLLLDDGRIRVIHDSAGTGLVEGRSARALGPRLGRDMTIITFPASGFSRYLFSAVAPKLAAFQTLTAPPAIWPEADSWLDTPWDRLDADLAG